MLKLILRKTLIFFVTMSLPIFILKINLVDKILEILILSIALFFINILIKNRLNLALNIIIFIFIFIKLIIIPLSFYIPWFSFIQIKIPQGKITEQIVYLIIFIWFYYICNINKKNCISSIFSLLVFINLFISFHFNNILVFTVLFLLILVRILYPIFNIKQNYKKSSIITTLIISFIISSAIYISTIENGSKLINKLSYKIKKVIIDRFPEYDLLTSIPGLSNNFSYDTGKPPILTTKPILKLEGTPGTRYYLRVKIGRKRAEQRVYNKTNYINDSNNYIVLTVMSDFLPVLPTTINTIDSDRFIFPDKINSTLKLNLPLAKGETFKLYEDVNTNIEPIEITEPIVSNKIKELAIKLKGNSDIETINNIREYLLSNYKYSLDTRENLDYIEEFLFNKKEGFCIHFTRSFIILAKLNGIITREVSGYLVDFPEDIYVSGSQYIYVSGKNAHLWPEVYINNKWKTFEVTQGIYRDEQTDILNLDKIDVKNKNFVNTIVTENNDNTFLKRKYLLLLLLFPICLTLYLLLKKRKNYIKLIIKKAEKQGIPHPKTIGWVEWNNSLTNNKFYENLFLELAYNNKIIDKNVINELRKLLKSL